MCIPPAGERVLLAEFRWNSVPRSKAPEDCSSLAALQEFRQVQPQQNCSRRVWVAFYRYDIIRMLLNGSKDTTDVGFRRLLPEFERNSSGF